MADGKRLEAKVRRLSQYTLPTSLGVFVWLVLNVMDWGITVWHFALGGIEVNAIFASMNGIAFVLTKMLLPLLLVVGLWYAGKLRWIWACSAGMIVVVVWNLQWLLWIW